MGNDVPATRSRNIDSGGGEAVGAPPLIINWCYAYMDTCVYNLCIVSKFLWANFL